MCSRSKKLTAWAVVIETTRTFQPFLNGWISRGQTPLARWGQIEKLGNMIAHELNEIPSSALSSCFLPPWDEGDQKWILCWEVCFLVTSAIQMSILYENSQEIWRKFLGIWYTWTVQFVFKFPSLDWDVLSLKLIFREIIKKFTQNRRFQQII